MNKAEIIDAVAGGANLTKADAKKAIDAMFTAIQETLKKGDSVVIKNVGKFQVVKRNQRFGRNPQTGKAITIPSKNIVKFKCGNCPPPGIY